MGVAIRITHKRTIRRMNTGIYVSATDLTKSLKLKNQILIDQLTDMIRELRTQFNTLGIAAEQMSADEVVQYIKQAIEQKDGFFIRGEGGYMEASNRYFERTREITDALGEAAQRYMGISGKNMGQRWLRAQAQARRSPLTFSLQLNDGSQPQVISATQALYLRALEKQTDGQVKLRAMGISEEVMEQISQTLQQEAPEMVAAWPPT